MVELFKNKVFGVFRGGGVRCIAIVGALSKAIEYVDFVAVAGTSGGSLVAAFLAAGFSPEEMYQIMLQKNFRDFLDGNKLLAPFNILFSGGIHPGNELRKWIDENLFQKYGRKRESIPLRMSELKIPLYIIACDLKHHMERVYSSEIDPSMEVSHAVRLSCGLPVVFKAETHSGRKFVDGGVLNNFPVNVFMSQSKAKKIPILGFRLVDQRAKPRGNSRFIYFDILRTVLSQPDARGKFDDEIDLIEIDTCGIKATDFNLTNEKKERLFQNGFEAADQYFSTLRKPKNIVTNAHIRTFSKRTRRGATETFSLLEDGIHGWTIESQELLDEIHFFGVDKIQETISLQEFFVTANIKNMNRPPTRQELANLGIFVRWKR